MIIIVDYGMGNLGSIMNMLKKIGAAAMISGSQEDIRRASRLILPGVGAFDNGMKNLCDRGLIPALTEKVIDGKTPILGICLGMQLLTRGSEEGKMPGLGWIDAQTIRFKPPQNEPNFKIPHMGWNTIKTNGKDNSLFRELLLDARFYFVHSYHLTCTHETDVLAWTRYGYDFPAAIRHNNVMGVQFHPEKSHKFGMRLLKNYSEMPC